ncbi:MAG: hypothetical protein ACYTGZ_14405 [Planctomycetota bacterium]|jgi:hypothetical protein
MQAQRVLGIVPHVPSNRPRASARWWCADGVIDGDTLRIERLDEQAEAPAITAPCGLAAPCSLPSAFVAYLDSGAHRESLMHVLHGWTAKRLFSAARRFASRQQRGQRHPRRHANESMSALDRRRLARFHAALPLLTTCAVRPWSDDTSAYLFEVDVPAWLAALDLPAHHLSGDEPEAIARRVAIVHALEEGRAGLRLALAERAYAIATLPALEAVVAAFAAAHVTLFAPPQPDAGADSWIPVP